MDKYATHLEPLVAAVMASAPYPILELGCGDYSTPVLAAIARAQGRRMLVQASDESWTKRYRDLAGVEIEIVDWKVWTPPAGHWGAVLLDSEESTAGRIVHIPKLLGRADLVVVHDADSAMTRRHWDECVKGWSIDWFKRFVPWTAVLRRPGGQTDALGDVPVQAEAAAMATSIELAASLGPDYVEISGGPLQHLIRILRAAAMQPVRTDSKC